MDQKRVSVTCVIWRPSPAGQGHEILLGQHRERGWENCGGKVEAQERCCDAILREIEEETGLRASDPATFEIVRQKTRIYEPPTAPNWVCVVYTGRVIDPTWNPGPPPEQTHAEWRWVNVNEIPRMEGVWGPALDVLRLTRWL